VTLAIVAEVTISATQMRPIVKGEMIYTNIPHLFGTKLAPLVLPGEL